MTRSKTHEEFVRQLKKVNPYIVPLTTYTNSHSKVLFRCTICGREWESLPYHQLNRTGFGCPQCAHKANGARRRKTNEAFVEELRGKNPNITPLESYKGNKQKIKCQCKLCGNIWGAVPDSLLHGIGCPKCYHSSTSFIEQYIYHALCFVLGDDKVVNRDRKAIGKELDIYVPSLKLAVEYGSWYWHRKRTRQDAEKRKLCQENGIRLISIYDSCRDDLIEECQDYYTFSFDLSLEGSLKSIKQIIMSICNQFELDCSNLTDLWDSINELAYRNSRKLTTADFIKLVKEKNTHNIDVLGEYKSSYTAILCRCRDCGYEWSPRPNNLLNENAGCPQCAGNIPYTNAEFVSEVESVNPDFELLEPYKSLITSVLCRCKKCGYVWKASPGKLLKKRSGCPRCIGHVRYSTDEFREKLHKISPDIIALEPYPKNNKTKIKCLCKNCGNEFSMRPNSLLLGQGCPKCAIVRVGQMKIKDGDAFIQELNAISPDIIVLEPYHRSKSKVLCRCKTCGNEWRATPNSLLHGYGCPQCAREKQSKRKMKSVLCVETNTVYESLKDASAQSGFSMSALSMCCNGKREMVGGCHWKYINNE